MVPRRKNHNSLCLGSASVTRLQALSRLRSHAPSAAWRSKFREAELAQTIEEGEASISYEGDMCAEPNEDAGQRLQSQ